MNTQVLSSCAVAPFPSPRVMATYGVPKGLAATIANDQGMWVTNVYNGLAFLLSGPSHCELCISKKKKKRIAVGVASAGTHPYLPRAGLVILVESASKSG